MRHSFRPLLGAPGPSDVPLCGATLDPDWKASPSAPACPVCVERARKLLRLRIPT